MAQRPKKIDIKSYQAVLQPAVSIDDHIWSYTLPDLPSPPDTNRLDLIKAVSLKTDGTTHTITLQLQPVSSNRALRGDPLDKFILLSFANFHTRSLFNADPRLIGNQPATPRQCTDYMVKLLCAGIILQGVHYNFYGHSNSQLKSRTCFLYAASKDVITTKVNALGDFGKMKTVQKKAKRIGLLFSSTEVARTVDPKCCEDIPDVETKDYVFTDGCGLIAPALARELAKGAKIVFRNQKYCPSVFQIRYRGYKGVVTVDPRMKEKGGPLLRMRKSMKKFAGGDDYSFAVVGKSKPYTFAHLNDEVILLLHSLGISRDTLLRKQQDHFTFLASAPNDTPSAFRFLAYANHFDLAEKVILDSLDAVRPQVQRLVKDEHDKMINKRNEQKCRILIPQSRLLFGVCDAWDVLEEGECHVRITHEASGLPATLINCDVVVTRNPCLHPGDLQKFRAVQKDELSHLVDCIVFSTRGKRPAADLMSGGDLDGDQFTVFWDKDLVPSTVSEAAEYPGAKEPVPFEPITDKRRLVYFAKFNSSSLGRAKNLYLDWARVTGPLSRECQQLNRLFSTCVDGNHISIPKQLESPPKPPPDSPPFILDELHEAAKQVVTNWQWQTVDSSSQTDLDLGDYTPETIEVLLSRQDLLVSEFELIQLTWRWCRKNGSALKDFVHFFDFTLLNAEQKQWVLSQLPPTELYEMLVQNSLCKSHLVEVRELDDSKLNYQGLRWKRVFGSHEARMGGFMEAAAKVMELFDRKLIVYRVDERLTLAIYVPMKLEKARESRVDDKVRLLAFPHSQGEETTSRLTLPTKKNYKLYYDDNSFQLYENKRGNTWVFIGRRASNDNRYRNVEGVGNKRRARQTTLDDGTNFDVVSSVDLKRFNSRLKEHVGRVYRNGVLGAEIYVISNRDTSSLRNLDLWSQYIDTQNVIPLFEQNAKQYTIATLGDVDWASQPEFIRQIVKRESLVTLLMLETKEQYLEVFLFLLDHDQKELLIRCFDYLLSSFTQRMASTVEPATVLYEMLGVVTKCPILAISFTRLECWSRLTEEVVDVLQANAEILLNAFIRAANTVGAAVIAPFQTVLARITILPISTCGRLVELIALAVRSPELAFDLLLGSLERESERLVPGRPAVVRHAVRNLIGIAMDHISEAAERGKNGKPREDLVDLSFVPGGDAVNVLGGGAANEYPVIEARFRIDARGGTPENTAHCRLTAAAPPSNALIGRVYSMDAIVISSTPGAAKFRCLHPPPSFLASSSWKLTHCGPFATSKTMLDAILDLALTPTTSCPIAPLLTPYRASPLPGLFLPLPSIHLPLSPRLNSSQSSAVLASLTHPLTCLWGPPGTGKTETTVAILAALRAHHPDVRLLVTAPTHNAVDNVMLRYLASSRPSSDPPPLRVSTEVRKVSPLLLPYTVDALVGGEDMHSSRAAYTKAKKQVARATVVFSTCSGAGLGLLRGQQFGAVVVDEASQVTEPGAMVPLVKGCEKAVLVGDHVQLRPTVGKEAGGVGFEVSLFERVFTAPRDGEGVARRMLDVQYRMHGDICEVVSGEFYEGRLKTGVEGGEREVGASGFAWPVGGGGRTGRMVFVECADPEDLMRGGTSHSNQGQARVCVRVCTMLSEGGKEVSIAVLTPYTAQVALLSKMLGGLGSHIEVCSVDGFQGREADVVVFVTVRCNPHQEIGFLKDRRRINVALTRAKRGVVLIGSESTLTMGTEDPESAGLWKRLLGKMGRVIVK